MGACTCNPEIDSRYPCMKHNVYVCEGCLTCRDPQIYCKHRPSCAIWFMTKHPKGLDESVST